MAQNLNVSWVLPTVRESGKPLNPADIAGVELSISADNTNWSVYNTFAPTVLTTVIPELESGAWWVRGVVKDTAGRVSKPVVSTITLPDTTAPGALASLTLAL